MDEARSDLRHVHRERGSQGERFLGARMHEGEMRRVERVPCDWLRRSAIEIVAEQRMSAMGKMDADLVRAPRVKPQAQEAVFAVRMLRFIMGACGLAVLCHAAEDDARQGTRNRCINTARRGHERAFDQGEVFAPQRILAHDLVLHLGMLCDEEQPACIAVEAVAGVNVEMDAADGIVSAHGVCDGAARFLCRRMDELSCGFVEDEQVVILIDDRKR